MPGDPSSKGCTQAKPIDLQMETISKGAPFITHISTVTTHKEECFLVLALTVCLLDFKKCHALNRP